MGGEHRPDGDAATGPTPREHREFTRVAIGKRVELRSGEQIISSASIASLSLGGLMVRSEQQLPVAARCEITIYLVEGEARLQIHARGSVVRADRWGMALKFSKVLGLDSLEGLHGLVLDNTSERDRVEREFQTHQAPRRLGSASLFQSRRRNGEAAPLWMRRTRRSISPRGRLHRETSTRVRAEAWLSPAHEQILSRIESMPEELNSLKSLCRRYLQYCSTLNVSVCLIGHRSWEAPLDYLIELYPPARKSWFQTYRRLHGIVLPRTLQSLLCACNGFSFGDFVCFGIPPSMLCTPPTLDENTWQPFDIGTATTEWIQDFPKAQGMTYFAGGPSAQGESAGYFTDGEQIIGMHSDGTVIGSWSQLETFLEDVLVENDGYIKKSIPEGWWR
jgi:hypothetical protein